MELIQKQIFVMMLGLCADRIYSDGGMDEFELERFVIDEINKAIVIDKIDLHAMFADVMQMSVFVNIGGKIMLSERGKKTVLLATKKIAVADLIGDKTISFSEKERNDLKNSSSSLPG